MTEAQSARSRAAFAKRFPDFAPPGVQQATTVRNGERPVDIAVGDRLLYRGDAQKLSGEQVAAFLGKPTRIIMQDPRPAGIISPLCATLLDRLNDVLVKGGSGLGAAPDEASTFLVIFGLGLGYHLEELIRRTRARWIIIVEPFPEFIAHSYQAIDWTSIFDLVDAANGAIHLVTDLDPAQMATSIVHRMAVYGTSYIDGTWLYVHYPLWAFGEGIKRLHDTAEHVFANMGFFEDELVMMNNATANFTGRSFNLIHAVPRRERPETAVIVGSGPSLDESMAKIKEIRERVVLFSAGTALRPLLRNGIMPDFHCELENLASTIDVLAEARNHGDLSKVRLIASATVDPRMPPMFGECFLFFRQAVSSTQIFQGGYREIELAAPTCVNTAFGVGAALGFTKFLLFGTDCGVKLGREDHAEGTVYNDIFGWKGRPDLLDRYPIQVEGNFGGIARTNWLFDASRRLIGELIAAKRLSVINCSDGALIPGAVPRVPDSLTVGGPAIDHTRLVMELRRTTIAFQPGELVRSAEFLAVGAQMRRFYRDLAALMDGFDRERADFADVYRALGDLFRAAGTKYNHTEVIPEGTVAGLARIGMYYGSRVGDPCLRRPLYGIFLDAFRQICSEMEQRTDEMFQRIGERLAACADGPAQQATGT